VLGRLARVSRVSFTGELTFEISVPADTGMQLWEALMAAGAADDIQPLGIEALQLLRLEKGYLHVGTDTDGTTVPDDVGYGHVIAAKQCDFIGRRSLAFAENVRPDRLQLVGLVGLDAADIAVGSHLRLSGTTAATDGWVTSAGRTVADDKAIALALLRGGRQRLGTTVSVHNFGQETRASVVEPPFYDPQGARANG
jgi:sarcosine oxidase subunit alpha